jgi:hypothetical protein
VRQIWHSGSRLGQIAIVVMVPDHRFAMVALTNANAGRALVRDVRRWVLKQYVGCGIPEPEPIEVSECELAAYVGRYSRPMADIELRLLCGYLVGQMIYKQEYPSSKSSSPIPPPPPMQLALCAADRLLVVSGPRQDERIDVIRKPDGSVGWLREHDRIYQRCER